MNIKTVCLQRKKIVSKRVTKWISRRKFILTDCSICELIFTSQQFFIINIVNLREKFQSNFPKQFSLLFNNSHSWIQCRVNSLFARQNFCRNWKIVFHFHPTNRKNFHNSRVCSWEDVETRWSGKWAQVEFIFFSLRKNLEMMVALVLDGIVSVGHKNMEHRTHNFCKHKQQWVIRTLRGVM